MTSHRVTPIDEPKSLSMTGEEKETTLSEMSAIIESADPPAWAGLPLPQKLPWWKRALEWAQSLLW